MRARSSRAFAQPASSRIGAGTLQSYVSHLRRALAPGRGQGQAPAVLVSEAPGYVLRLAPVPLYNRYRDVYDAVRSLKRTLDA